MSTNHEHNPEVYPDLIFSDRRMSFTAIAAEKLEPCDQVVYCPETRSCRKPIGDESGSAGQCFVHANVGDRVTVYFGGPRVSRLVESRD